CVLCDNSSQRNGGDVSQNSGGMIGELIPAKKPVGLLGQIDLHTIENNTEGWDDDSSYCSASQCDEKEYSSTATWDLKEKTDTTCPDDIWLVESNMVECHAEREQLESNVLEYKRRGTDGSGNGESEEMLPLKWKTQPQFEPCYAPNTIFGGMEC